MAYRPMRPVPRTDHLICSCVVQLFDGTRQGGAPRRRTGDGCDVGGRPQALELKTQHDEDWAIAASREFFIDLVQFDHRSRQNWRVTSESCHPEAQPRSRRWESARKTARTCSRSSLLTLARASQARVASR